MSTERITPPASKREYDNFLHRKVERARAQIAAGLHYSNEEVETEMATLRADLLRRAEAEGK